MSWFIYILLGFALGIEFQRMQSGRKCDWKKATIALVVAAVVAGILAWLIR
jgi:hypothetical protein